MKNKRGFSIAEAVIALALITVVSLASLSLLLSAGNATKRALYRAEAQNAATDVINTWRTSDTLDKNALAFTFGITPDDVAPEGTGYKFSLPQSGYTVTTNLADTTLTVTVTNGSREITSATFTKPVGTGTHDSPI